LTGYEENVKKLFRFYEYVWVLPMETRTIDRGPAIRLYLRIAEMAFFFFFIPVLMYYFRGSLAFKIIPLGIIAALISLFLLRRESGLDLSRLWDYKNNRGEIKRIFVSFIPGALFILVFSYVYAPEHFLAFPKKFPAYWFLFMIIYPLLAAYPQEIIFRMFFIERYRPLFTSNWSLVVFSGTSFGLAHIIYGNWIAPLFAGLGGVLFAYHYLSSRSVLAAAIEHGLWGCIIFTSGIGKYFSSSSIL
jgi:membrane protease YdiL (CAAX protease family)